VHIYGRGAEPSPSQTKQRKPTKQPSSKRNPLFNNNYISVHSRSFHEVPFVGNPSFNTNSLPAWVTAISFGAEGTHEAEILQSPSRKDEAKAASGYISK